MFKESLMRKTYYKISIILETKIFVFYGHFYLHLLYSKHFFKSILYCKMLVLLSITLDLFPEDIFLFTFVQLKEIKRHFIFWLTFSCYPTNWWPMSYVCSIYVHNLANSIEEFPLFVFHKQSLFHSLSLINPSVRLFLCLPPTRYHPLPPTHPAVFSLALPF